MRSDITKIQLIESLSIFLPDLNIYSYILKCIKDYKKLYLVIIIMCDIQGNGI